MTLAKIASTESSQSGQKFLQFQLGTNVSALLEAKIVKEIIAVPEKEILPVPEMPNWVFGIYGYRSEILWMIDLKILLEYPSSWLSLADNHPRNRSLMTIVVCYQEQMLGLIVPNVQGIIEYNLSELHPPSSELFAPEILPFVEGHFTGNQQEIIMLLNPDEIFEYQKNRTVSSLSVIP
ncbi:CheW protein [Rippkaea orientalis PCC 8801]|uniref:CheW protein n=1 Tax=Rippkaea orientalis (strain PCC 8801 / RF-1) TaxID=41431 RepID=B7K5D1_RIPO1|nr:chemotaxis protein CheW [Rippkaea orientalis]ACK67957.1 CheW protein [Rippkaea orientalis PCC 8801]